MSPQQELVTEKAVRLFGVYGVKTVTMDDVAAACGMSKKTVYNLFENKDELIQTVIAHLTTNYTQAYNHIRQTCATAPEEVLASVSFLEEAFREMTHRLLSEIYKYHYQTSKKIDAFRDSVVLDFIKSNLRRGQEQGYYHRCFDNDVIAAMRLRELNALHGAYAEATERHQLREVLMQVAFHYLAGIATPKGAQLLKKKYKIIYPPKADDNTTTP